MRIKSLQLKNFKRFTDLTLQDIPESAKLVLLVGSNGSGKSSVFDAFEYVASAHKTFIGNSFELFTKEMKLFYGKNKEAGVFVNIATTKGAFTRAFSNYEFGPSSEDVDFPSNKNLKSFYGRSAFRYLPSLTKKGYNTGFDIQGDIDRPKFYNEVDSRFVNDIDIIMEEVMKIVFIDFQDGIDRTDKIRDFVNRINLSFINIFGDKPATGLRLRSIRPPADGKPIQLMFDKGKSEIHYNVLSAGEKEVINLIFNLYTRTPYFDDTIYFIDEMDSHLNTSLQYNLLKEITENWIPENCQLWTASHSLGFIQYANESSFAVSFDFKSFDFDEEIVLRPIPKERSDIYEIAVGKNVLTSLFKDFNIVFAENTDVTNYYSNLNIEKFIMVRGSDKAVVYENALLPDFFGLIDRDFLSDDDIIALRRNYLRLRVLNYYSVENYLFHPDNLEEYFMNKNYSYDKNEYEKRILEGKEKVKSRLTLKLLISRSKYPFGKEPNSNMDVRDRFKLPSKNEKSKANEEQCLTIAEELDSNELEVFYKHLPMKDYLKDLAERQIIARTDLAKTNWFKTQIEKILNEPN